MQATSKIDSSEYTDLNRVIGWFIGLRWIACLAVFITLLIVDLALRFSLPYSTLFTLNGLLFLINLSFTAFYRISGQNLSRSQMGILFHLQVSVDYALLFLVIYFTGFLENPFAYFFIFHILLTSFIFPSAAVFAYVACLLAVFVGGVFAEYFHVIPHFPLNVADFRPEAYFSSIFAKATGLCSTLVVSAYLITSIKKRIEERGKRIEVELNHFKDLDNVKSNFILQVTHELRGPLAALSGYHEMVIKGVTGGVNAKTKDAIQKANRRTENLLTIIDEMIDFAYMKSEEEARYSKTGTSLRKAIEHNVGLFSGRAGQKNIQFVFHCPEELLVWANRDLLNIILSNLITNAVKYSPEGTTITVNATQEKGGVHVLVKDEGMGIEPEELEKIFEEFYRARRAREIERDGTGLGLPIVKRAVEALGGKVSVYSEVGRGSSVHVYLQKYEPQTVKSGGKNGR